MKKTLCILTSILIITVIIFASTNSYSATKYSVYCANDKIEVDSRDFDQMKSARGSNTCIVKQFDYSSDADNFAKKLGGKGASCKCK
jgi:hypothetical protein